MEQNITLASAIKSVTKVVHVVQNDTGRVLKVRLDRADLTTAMTYNAIIEKPSGLSCYIPASFDATTGLISVELTNQALAEEGNAKAQIEVIDTDGVVTTYFFYIAVERALRDDNTIESSNEFTALQAMGNSIAQAKAQFDNAIRAVTTDTEVTDIRAKADGTTASTAGNAVREQVGGIYNELGVALDNLLSNKASYHLPYTKGVFIDRQTGAERADASWEASDFVELGNMRYRKLVTSSTMQASYNIYNAFYNASKQYISSFTLGDEVVDVPTGAVYFRTSKEITATTTINPYIPKLVDEQRFELATNQINNINLKVADLEEFAETTEADVMTLKEDLTQLSESIGGIADIKKSPNILDWNSVESGKRMSPGGSLTDDANGYIYTYPVKLLPRETIRITTNKSFNWRGNFINAFNDGASSSIYVQFTENSDGTLTATYNNNQTVEQIIKICIIASATQIEEVKKTLMFVVGDDVMPDVFAPYGTITKLNDGIVTENSLDDGIVTENSLDDELKSKLFDTWYKGKKLVSFGDSITAMGYWQPLVVDYFLMSNHINRGIGGTTVHNDGQQKNYNGSLQNSWMCSDERIAWLPEDADVVLVMGGMNDWGTEIGELATGNNVPSDTTFIGAYQIMLTKLIKKYPNAKIFTMTITNGRVWSYGTNKDNPPVNYGHTIRDYAEATKMVSAVYGIPCIDLNGECGFSFVNSSDYLQDSTHPNDSTGAKAIANAVINGLKRYEPIAL